MVEYANPLTSAKTTAAEDEFGMDHTQLTPATEDFADGKTAARHDDFAMDDHSSSTINEESSADITAVMAPEPKRDLSDLDKKMDELRKSLAASSSRPIPKAVVVSR